MKTLTPPPCNSFPAFPNFVFFFVTYFPSTLFPQTTPTYVLSNTFGLYFLPKTREFLCLIMHHNTNSYGRCVVLLHAFLTSVLEERRVQLHAPVALRQMHDVTQYGPKAELDAAERKIHLFHWCSQ
jgi:hypothetical protein